MKLYSDVYTDNDGNKRGGYLQSNELMQEYPSVHLWYLLGKRGIGKTYGIKEFVLKEFFKHGKLFVFVRRVSTDLQGSAIIDVFSDITSPVIKRIMSECHFPDYGYEEYAIQPKSGKFYIVGKTGVGEKDDFLEPVGLTACVSQAEKFKNGAYDSISAIIFDEFITERGYFKGNDEPQWFSKIVNTVGRIKNKDLMIFMLGNPDYNIASCPYLYTLQLDVPRLQKDVVYLYDSKIENEKGVVRTIANNVGFIWLKGVEGVIYLSPNTSNLWDTAEERMGLTGELKTHNLLNYDTIKDVFIPYYEMCVETPVFSNDYKKCLWVYVGTGRVNEPVTVVLSHRLKNIDVPRVDCRYDENIYLPNAKYPCIYRINFPKHKMFSHITSMLSYAIVSKLIYTDNNSNGTLFLSILNE